VNTLPEHDLFYLMDDIREPSGMQRWIEGLRQQKVFTVLAEVEQNLLAYGSLRCGRMAWTRHLGEVRIMVSPQARGRGLGKVLGKEVFAVAHDLGLRRLIVRLTSAQIPARYLFQHLGFHIEALLAECVIDEQGQPQDLIFMSYDVAGFHV
jgi:L-amino acid N-acyltransferase YncA